MNNYHHNENIIYSALGAFHSNNNNKIAPLMSEWHAENSRPIE